MIPLTDQQAKELIVHLNTLMAALYGPDQRVSRMLTQRGISQQEIAILRRRLPYFSTDCARAVLGCVHELYSDDPRADRFVTILCARYALDNRHTRTLQEIGEELEISRERVRQLQVKLLGKLRRPHSRELLEEAMLSTARTHIYAKVKKRQEA